MANKKKTEVRVGIVVLVGILLIVWVIGWAKNIALFSEERELNILFNQVPGLEIGSMVSVNGVRSGKVEDIISIKEGILVKALMDPEVFINNDATYSIMMLDLMGGKKIEIVPGTSLTEIDYSQVQTGKFLGDISTAMAMLSSVQNDLVLVIKDVRVAVSTLNDLMGGDEMKNKIISSLDNLNNLTIKVTKVIENNQQQISSLLKQSNQLVENTNSVVAENRDSFKKVLEDVSLTLTASNKLIQKIDKIAADTENKENNLGRLLYDEKLYDDIQTNISQLKKLTQIILEQIQNDGFKVDANIF